MNKSLELKEQVVESICAEGCKYVNQLLASTALQVEHVQFKQLNRADQKWILIELNSVMSVYENSGSCGI